MEKMTISDLPQSTQAFVVSKTTPTIPNSDNDMDQEISFICQNDPPLTQTFNTVTAPTPISIQSTSTRDSVIPTLTNKIPESVDVTNNKIHPTVPFQLAPPPIHNRPTVPITSTSSIQPQVTSNDVQQMLLTFSSDPSSIHEQQQPQPMEDDPMQSQQRPTFSMPSSIESTTSTEE